MLLLVLEFSLIKVIVGIRAKAHKTSCCGIEPQQPIDL